MTTLISKLQFKDFEEGEFTNEQPRNLLETLQLIHDYPWNTEAGFLIPLTAPSVTIENSHGSYLKIARDQSPKFCIFLFKGFHIYEQNLLTFNDVADIVTSFFNDTLSLDIFSKDYSGIMDLHHFKTNPFKYHTRYLNVISNFIFLLIPPAIPFMPTLALLVNWRTAPVFLIILLLIETFLLFNVYCYIKICFKSIGYHIRISAGNPLFYVGKRNYDVVYQKDDIADITFFEYFGPENTRQHLNIIIYQICFKNGLNLNLSSLLISHDELERKFPGFEIKHVLTFDKNFKAIMHF